MKTVLYKIILCSGVVPCVDRKILKETILPDLDMAKGEHSSMFKFLITILFWIGVYAFFMKKKHDTSFGEEYKNAVLGIIGFFKGLKNTPEKPITTTEDNEEKEIMYMKNLAASMNHQVSQMIQYRYPSNHGWKYSAYNWEYLITHNYPVTVEILVTSKQVIEAKVVIKKGVVCDVVSCKFTPSINNFNEEATPQPAPAPTPQPVPESAPTPQPEEKPENPTEEKPLEEENATSKGEPSEEDEKKAASIAANYIIDNMELLNSMANDAVAMGKSIFVINNLPGDELAWNKIVDGLHNSNFVNCKVVGNTIEVGVNLDVPADDGNFDFEKKEKEEEPVEEVSSQDIENAIDSEAAYEVIANSEDFIIPSEPEDIPEQ